MYEEWLSMSNQDEWPSRIPAPCMSIDLITSFLAFTHSFTTVGTQATALSHTEKWWTVWAWFTLEKGCLRIERCQDFSLFGNNNSRRLLFAVLDPYSPLDLKHLCQELKSFNCFATLVWTEFRSKLCFHQESKEWRHFTSLWRISARKYC